MRNLMMVLMFIGLVVFIRYALSWIFAIGFALLICAIIGAIFKLRG